MVIDDLIEYAKDNDCSDIHITCTGEIALRQYGKLRKLENTTFTRENLDNMIYEMMDGKQNALYTSGKDLDFSYQAKSGIRCRVNTYHQQNSNVACLRIIGSQVPKFDDLNLPDILKNFIVQPSGLVVVTGPTGSGKTTTLAAMVDYLNNTTAEHVLTIEDPIEYRFDPYYCTIHQREIGRDVPSFADALRSSLREDPDVILVGEMRDYETVSAALTAAETGHLVVSTLHTVGTADTINRIIDFFPPHSQGQVRSQLASVLRGVITQRLVLREDESGRIPATEILVNTDAVSNLIRTDKVHQIETALHTGVKDGMHTLNMNLKELIQRGIITKEAARKWSNNPKEFI